MGHGRTHCSPCPRHETRHPCRFQPRKATDPTCARRRPSPLIMPQKPHTPAQKRQPSPGISPLTSHPAPSFMAGHYLCSINKQHTRIGESRLSGPGHAHLSQSQPQMPPPILAATESRNQPASDTSRSSPLLPRADPPPIADLKPALRRQMSALHPKPKPGNIASPSPTFNANCSGNHAQSHQPRPPSRQRDCKCLAHLDIAPAIRCSH
jgi:hypothetical protein